MKTTDPEGIVSIYGILAGLGCLENAFPVTYIMSSRLRFVLVVLANILHGVCWTNDLGRALLSLWGPHCKTSEEAAVRNLELEKRIGNIASSTANQKLLRG